MAARASRGNLEENYQKLFLVITLRNIQCFAGFSPIIALALYFYSLSDFIPHELKVGAQMGEPDSFP